MQVEYFMSYELTPSCRRREFDYSRQFVVLIVGLIVHLFLDSALSISVLVFRLASTSFRRFSSR